MTGTRPTNPFQWYMGKVVQLRCRPHVIEDCEVRGRDLSFRLRDTETGTVRYLSPTDVIDRVEAGGLQA